MNFGMIFRVAARAIARNKTRSVLTCIGIIVGIAAVIAVMAIGAVLVALCVGSQLRLGWGERNPTNGSIKSNFNVGLQTTFKGAFTLCLRKPRLINRNGSLSGCNGHEGVCNQANIVRQGLDGVKHVVGGQVSHNGAKLG